MSRLMQFVLGGAQKSGTTTLFEVVLAATTFGVEAPPTVKLATLL